MKIENLTSGDFEIPAARSERVLLVDIETAPNLGYVWDIYEQDVLKVVERWHILAFCAKWLGSNKYVSRILPDYKGYKPYSCDDRALVDEIGSLFTEADVVVGHNVKKFDEKKINTRLLIHGHSRPQPYEVIDTLLEARRHFAFGSNRLEAIGQALGVGSKVKHTGVDMWFKCMAGDSRSWNLMRKYNRQDVTLLEAVYLKMRPWIGPTHPNIAILKNIPNGCRNCGSSNLTQQGRKLTKSGFRQQFKCKNCGAWMSGGHKPVSVIR